MDDERTHLYRFNTNGDGYHSLDCWCKFGKNEELEPKNNDGRKKCYWCKSYTETKQLATSNYQVCTKCGK